MGDDYVEVDVSALSGGDDNDGCVAMTGTASRTGALRMLLQQLRQGGRRSYLVKDLWYPDEELEKPLAEFKTQLQNAVKNLRQARSSGVSKSPSRSQSRSNSP